MADDLQDTTQSALLTDSDLKSLQTQAMPQLSMAEAVDQLRLLSQPRELDPHEISRLAVSHSDLPVISLFVTP